MGRAPRPEHDTRTETEQRIHAAPAPIESAEHAVTIASIESHEDDLGHHFYTVRFAESPDQPITLHEGQMREGNLLSAKPGDTVTFWGTVRDGKPVLSEQFDIGGGAPLPRGAETAIRASMATVFPAIGTTLVVAGVRQAVKDGNYTHAKGPLGGGAGCFVIGAMMIALMKHTAPRPRTRPKS